MTSLAPISTRTSIMPGGCIPPRGTNPSGCWDPRPWTPTLPVLVQLPSPGSSIQATVGAQQLQR